MNSLGFIYDYARNRKFYCKLYCFYVNLQSKGPEALEFLQYLSSNNIEQPIGTIIHTGMQNEFGGYENDCTIVPMENNT